MRLISVGDSFVELGIQHGTLVKRSGCIGSQASFAAVLEGWVNILVGVTGKG